VAELLLSFTSASQTAEVAATIFGEGEAAAAALSELMANQFGNYVLQSLLRRLGGVSEAQGAQAYLAALQRVRDAQSAENYGRSILARLADGSVDGEAKA